MIFKKNDFSSKLNQLQQLLMTLENKDVKFNIIFTLSEDLILNICDKTSQRKIKDNDKKKKEE